MTSQRWLLLGGARYIGSHVADEFLASGKEVAIYDSLYQVLESRIQYLRATYKKEIPLIVADIRDRETFTKTLERYTPYGIAHTAALKAVGEPMEKPDEYFEVNFHATIKLLEIIASHKIHHFVIDSRKLFCAVDYCKAFNKEGWLYSDDNHLSKTDVKLYSADLAKITTTFDRKASLN